MKKYFYTDGVTRFGPYTLEELKQYNISRETEVWFQGLVDWQAAGNVPELSELFILTPPPLPYSPPHLRHSPPLPPPLTNANFISNSIGNSNSQKPLKTWLTESILVTIFCCFPFGILGIVNAARVEKRFDAGDIEGSKKASKEAEKWTKISFWLGLSIGITYTIINLFREFGGS